MLGGLLLVAIMLVSSVSVIGRGLSQLLGAKVSGIPGDIEIVQLGCAVAVFAFLPLCQLKRANVLVGAFTKNLPVRYRSSWGSWELSSCRTTSSCTPRLSRAANGTHRVRM